MPSPESRSGWPIPESSRILGEWMTYATMLGLLSVTGMRVSEVLNLDRDDVDLTVGVVIVRKSKFGKSRYLPVHESTAQALKRYARQTDRRWRRTPRPS